MAARKACIDLSVTLRAATLMAGDLGGGRCLFMVQLGRTCDIPPAPEEWQRALDVCHKKAEALRYDVTRVRGQSLTKEE